RLGGVHTIGVTAAVDPLVMALDEVKHQRGESAELHEQVSPIAGDVPRSSTALDPPVDAVTMPAMGLEAATLDLTVPSLDELHRRRSEKWALYDAHVLSLTVAEMDFPIADPIREVLVSTIQRGDLGYALPVSPVLAQA